MLEHEEWRIFSQIRTKDEDSLPAVLTREETIRLLRHIGLRRYRIPVKLIYCCGLRVSECLALTIHDIDAKNGKLWIRKSKGNKDRMVPISRTMVEDLRRYWAFHTGRPLFVGAAVVAPGKPPHVVSCPCCGGPMKKLLRLLPAWNPGRGPPRLKKQSCA